MIWSPVVAGMVATYSATASPATLPGVWTVTVSAEPVFFTSRNTRPSLLGIDSSVLDGAVCVAASPLVSRSICCTVSATLDIDSYLLL